MSDSYRFLDEESLQELLARARSNLSHTELQITNWGNGAPLNLINQRRHIQETIKALNDELGARSGGKVTAAPAAPIQPDPRLTTAAPSIPPEMRRRCVALLKADPIFADLASASRLTRVAFQMAGLDTYVNRIPAGASVDDLAKQLAMMLIQEKQANGRPILFPFIEQLESDATGMHQQELRTFAADLERLWGNP